MPKNSKKPLEQWLVDLETKHNKKIDLGLSRIQKVYDRLKLNKISPYIITIAGTNGKGSTVSILSSICRQAGYKVGEFTSPHLIRYNERIKVDGKQVSDNDIISAFELIEQNLDGVTLSYFEYSTLAAAIVFKKHKVDISLLEVGLGGRLDSVNVIDTDCAVITTIDIDHTSWLGNTKESIGIEKAGILRKSKPAIYADEDCPLSILKYAKTLNVNLTLFNQDYQIEQTKSGFNYQYQELRYYDLPKPNIRGDWQFKNAATAITALRSLDLKITKDNIRAGLVNIDLQGRLQQISQSPNVYIDVSHNAQAAEKLSSWLSLNPIEGQTYAVFAVLADKEAMLWLSYFENLIDVWCVSEVDSERALKTKDLILDLSKYSRLILSFENVKKAYLQSIKLASNRDRIIVFGSFYTVSEVLL